MRNLICPIMLLLVVVFSTHTFAQDTYQTANSVSVVKEHKSPLLTGLKADFANVTMEEVYTSIERALKNRVNIIIKPVARNVKIPSFTLQNANVLMVSELLCSLVDGLEADVYLKGELCSTNDCLHEYYSMMEDLKDMGEIDEQEYRFFQEDITTFIVVDMPRSDLEFRIIPVDMLIEGMGAEINQVSDLATAIETAWEMTTDSYVACLKYHKETKLLICSGTQKHLALVDEIIDMVTHGQIENSQLNRIQKMAAQIEKLQKEIATLKDINTIQQRTIKKLTQDKDNQKKKK